MTNKSNMKLWKSTTCLSIVGYAIGMGPLSHAATTLQAIVIPNTAGYVGSTAAVSSTLKGPLNGRAYLPWRGMSSISSLTIFECDRFRSTRIKQGLSGVYGFELTKPNGDGSGAVLVPDGTATWQRKIATGEVLTGKVVYDKGRWTNNWSPPLGWGRYTSSKSKNDGTSPYAEFNIFCPNLPPYEYTSPWDYSYQRSSSVNVRFFIDAPAGGLPPGKYSFSYPIYHTDISPGITGTEAEALADSVSVIVPNYSCSLSADKNSVDLNNFAPEATFNLRVQCQDDGSAGGATTVWLYTTSAGVSANINTGNLQMLGVQNSNGLMTLRGRWSATAPANCNDSSLSDTLYFDGRDGIKTGDVAVNGRLTKVQPVSFRLCTTGSPAAGASYSAQAIFGVVQR